MAFECSYAGVPFLLPTREVVEHAERLSPELYDTAYPEASWRGKAVGPAFWATKPHLRYGDFFYPTHASRWSEFRGLASTSQVKSMLAAAVQNGFASPQLFKLTCDLDPTAFNVVGGAGGISTNLYILPPRPLGVVQSGSQDGLWEVRLVDERFYWNMGFQNNNPTILLDGGTTWSTFLTGIFETGLGYGVGNGPTIPAIPAAYGTPEPDSVFAQDFGDLTRILDLALASVGLVFVRPLTTPNPTPVLLGVGNFQAWQGLRPTYRSGGGGFFDLLDRNGLTPALNAVLPITFDTNPVAYWPNYGYVSDSGSNVGQTERRIRHVSEPYPSAVNSSVTLAAMQNVNDLNGNSIRGGNYFGVQNVGAGYFLSTTARKYVNPNATNQSDVDALGVQLATDFFNYSVGAALDETYPGINTWPSDSLHDLLWHYSDLGAYTRVVRKPWFSWPRELIHRITNPTTNDGPNVQGVDLIRVNSATPDGNGYYDSFTQARAPGGTFSDVENVKLIDPSNGGFNLTLNSRFNARFMTFENGFKIYSLNTCQQVVTNIMCVSGVVTATLGTVCA